MASPQVNEIFDYLSAPSLLPSAEPAVIFGRRDILVAQAVGDLAIPHLITTAIITGGIGKDSGDNLRQGFGAETTWLARQLEVDSKKRGYALPPVPIEARATNGGENARFSLAMLAEKDFAPRSLTAVAHATSARRLAETLRFETDKTGVKLWRTLSRLTTSLPQKTPRLETKLWPSLPSH